MNAAPSSGTIAASAAIIRDKKILLIQRGDYTPEFPGFWAFPGGRADPDETPEQAVVREVAEEVNLKFEPVALLKTGTHKERHLFRYIGTWSGEVAPQNTEIRNWGWFTYEEARAMRLAFDYPEAIELLHARGLI